MAMIDSFSCKNARKRNKKHVSTQANNKERPLICLRKGYNFVIGLSKQTSKVLGMYLAIKNLNLMSSKANSFRKAISKNRFR